MSRLTDAMDLRLAEWISAADVLLKPAIAVLVLFLAAYLGRNPSYSALYPFLALLGALALLRRPELGLVALLVGALCVPFAVGTGTQTELNIAILLVPVLLGNWVFEMMRQGRMALAPSPANLPLLLLALSATISLAAGNLPWNYFVRQASLQAQVGGWLIFVLSVGLFLFTGNRVRDTRWLYALVGIFLAVGAIAVINLWVPPLPILDRVPLDAVQQESLFWVWIVALAGGTALFNRSLPLPVRLALLGLAAAAVATGWFKRQFWTSGYFPPLVALVALLWLRSWRLGLLVTLGGLFVLLVVRPEILSGVAGLKQYSTDTRLAAWDILLSDIIPISPLVGLGPANYYFYTPLVPILGYYVNFNSHSQYVDLLAQTGVVGLALFGWAMAAITLHGWRLRGRAPNEHLRGYVYACLAGILATVVAGWFGDWVLPFVYNIGLSGFRASMLPWLFAGGLVAISQIGLARPASDR